MAVIAAVDAPVLHEYDAAPVPPAVSTTLLPLQNVVAPDGVIVAFIVLIAIDPVSGEVRSYEVHPPAPLYENIL